MDNSHIFISHSSKDDEAESASIEQLFERGELQMAYVVAHQVLQRCLAAGEAAYTGAAYDMAVAYFRLGRVLKKRESAETALLALAEAQKRFQAMADAGDAIAERMTSVSMTEEGDCLRDLGR